MNLRRGISTFRGHRVPHMDLIGRTNLWFALSGVLIALSLVGLIVRGLNYSIDFSGGTVIQFTNTSGATVADYQAVMAKYGLPDATVELVGGNEVAIRLPSGALGLTPTPAATPSANATANPTPSGTASSTPSSTPTPTATGTASPTATPTTSASATGSPTPAATLPAPSPSPGSKADLLLRDLATTAGIPLDEINLQFVGPSWGKTIRSKAIFALILFLFLVTAYITLRFEWKMAVSALVALGHDLIITAGIYALVGREVTPETVIAILTILGYSLYDTVVIFDKIKENTESAALVAREGYAGVVNMSLNQTFMRSVNTSLVVLLPIGSLLLFGGQTLKNFAFALFVGVASGTYSSIFVAAPLLATLKEREPRYQAIRARALSRSARPGLRSAVPAVPGGDAQGDHRVDRTPSPVVTGAGAAPRPATMSSGGGTSRPRSSAAARRKKRGPQGKPKPRRR